MKRWLIIAALAAAGCGSSSMGVTGGDMGGGGGSGGGGGGGSGGGGGGGGGNTGGNGIVPPTATIGTFIVLGDSISDGGGEAPFYYEQLKTDFTAKWPGLMYVHAAQGGAITDSYSDNMPAFAPLLKTQVTNLGHTYPGDVLIAITIGGNDLNAHAAKAIGGTDGTVRAEFGTHLDAILGELTTAGRLGTGKVYIMLSNIYDFTDGMGDFAKVQCGPQANVSAMRDQEVFNGWNGVAAASLQKVGGALYDMHGDFMGHGYNNMTAGDVWYLKNGADCIHPNAKGHDSIRRAMYKIATGASLP
jgi:lysophospholipase L1-like esterase